MQWVSPSGSSAAPEAIYLLSRYAGRQTLDVARRANDAMARVVADGNGRLAGMASVNPFDATHVRELERAIGELHLNGVCVPSSWDGLYLDSGLATPFLECVEGLDLPVFIHPPLVPLGWEAMERYRLAETVGRVFDTTMTVSSMICAGVFDRFPTLKILVPHMGAGLMSVMGRLDMGHRLGYPGHAPYQAAMCERKPSEYLGNLYVDTMGFWPSMLKQLVEVFGPARVLFGTDYPAVPISPAEHIGLVESLELCRDEKEAILSRNALDLFKLEGR
jgi:predicted TIM-barrel fold metal-dependent hydrolase